jgi:hypothetical protein
MSNNTLIDELIRLGFRVGPLTVLTYHDLFMTVKAVKYGHATLTKHGRKTLMDLYGNLKYKVGE